MFGVAQIKRVLRAAVGPRRWDEMRVMQHLLRRRRLPYGSSLASGNYAPDLRPLFTRDAALQSAHARIRQARGALLTDTTEFFREPTQYAGKGALFRRAFPRFARELGAYPIYPPNLLAIEYVARHRFPVFIDYPCGVGETFMYIRVLSPTTRCIGVDSFAQIDRATVLAAQRVTARAEVYAPDDVPRETFRGACAAVIGLPVERVLDRVLALAPRAIVAEEFYLTPECIRAILRAGYRVKGHNPVAAYFSRGAAAS